MQLRFEKQADGQIQIRTVGRLVLGHLVKKNDGWIFLPRNVFGLNASVLQQLLTKVEELNKAE